MGVASRPGGNAPRRRTFRANVVLNYGTNLAVAVLALVNILIVARALGAIGRGDVAFLSAIVYLTANLAALGIHEANANFGAAEPERRPALATNSLVLSLVFSAAFRGDRPWLSWPSSRPLEATSTEPSSW